MSENKIIVMPLRKHFPLPKEPEWKSMICFECGRECWYIPYKSSNVSFKLMCFECKKNKQDNIIKKVLTNAIQDDIMNTSNEGRCENA